MSYQEISEVQTVVLGGTDKKSGKRNPTELEGYFIRTEERPNKFNPEKPQAYYVFLTSEGEKGVYGKAGIKKVMDNASLNVMTKLVDTGKTLDTGKGNPMRIFKAYQDKSNALDATAVESVLSGNSGDLEDLDESEGSDEIAYSAPTPPSVAASVPNAASRARVQSLLSTRHAK